MNPLETFLDLFDFNAFEVNLLSTRPPKFDEHCEYFQKAPRGLRFKTNTVTIQTRGKGPVEVPAKTLGGVAIIAAKYLKGMGNSNYGITHIATGLDFVHAQNMKEARAIAGGLVTSGLDLAGDPRKAPIEHQRALRNYMLICKSISDYL